MQNGEGARQPDPADRTGHFSAAAREELETGFLAAALEGDRWRLVHAVRAMTLEARAGQCAPERLVVEMNKVWRGIRQPALVGVQDWEELYRFALTRAMTIYFEETQS